MFERFTNRARRVLVLAQEEAASLQHSFIGTEHILLGLIHEGEGVGAKALQEVGIGLEPARDRVVAQIGRGVEPVKDKKVPFTARAKKVLELSLREALQLGHNYIGTEHLLLGLLREGEGVGGQVLREMGAEADLLRQKVVALLAGHAAPSKVPTEEELPFAFSAPARRVLPRANDLSRGEAITTEHLLLALVGEENGLAAKGLAALGVTPEKLAAQLADLRREGHRDSDTQEVEIAPGISLKVEHAGFDAEMLREVVRDAIFGRLQQEGTGEADEGGAGAGDDS